MKKKIILWVSSASLLAVILGAALFSGGCSKSDPHQPQTDDFIGIWTTQILGETGEDILSITMLFKNDSTVTFTTESDYDDTPERTDMYWSVDGNKITFAYVDEDEDGEPDEKDIADWDEYTFEMSDGTLTLTDEWGINIREYIKQ